MHARIFHFLQAASLACLLAFSAPAQSSGLGWYYESFSWGALQAYFGGADPRQKQAHRQHLKALVEAERKNPFHGIDLNERNLNLWREFMDKGIDYRALSMDDARFADEVISIVMGNEAGLDQLQVKSETNPDYIHSGAFRNLLQHTSNEKSLLRAFKFGRSLGQQANREFCFGKGSAWRCLDAYVILSPAESAELAAEIKSILKSRHFKQSEHQ